MSRYIDAERIPFYIRDVGDRVSEYDIRKIAFASEIANMPTADVVAVVRCRDCKHCRIEHRQKEKGKESVAVYVCNGIGVVDSTFYCACGERREE